MKTRWPYLLPTSILLLTTLATIVRRGIFVDGLIYVNLAKNLSQNIGSFWHPQLNLNGVAFHDHPPLAFNLEAAFFHVFGTNIPVEDLYNVVILGLTIVLMYALWRMLLGKEKQMLFYFPLLLWSLSEEVQLRYANNMLECTMTVFLLAGFCLYWKWRQVWPILALFALAVFSVLAFLTKGPVGLFLFVLPFADQILLQKRLLKGILFSSLTVFFAASLIFLLFKLWPASAESIGAYLDQQVLSALQGERHENIQSHRFAIVIAVLEKNLAAWILVALISLWPRLKRLDFTQATIALLLLIVALSGVLPIVVSMKQASYYQLPSLPFFMLGIGVLIQSRLLQIHEFLIGLFLKFPWAIKNGMAILLLFALFNVWQNWGIEDKRHKLVLQEVDEISKKLGASKEINYVIAPELQIKGTYPYYEHAGYLNRYYDVYINEYNRAKYTLIRHANDAPFEFKACEKELLARELSVLLEACPPVDSLR